MEIDVMMTVECKYLNEDFTCKMKKSSSATDDPAYFPCTKCCLFCPDKERKYCDVECEVTNFSDGAWHDVKFKNIKPQRDTIRRI